MKKKPRRSSRPFSAFFDIPADTFLRASAITLSSDREALVTGCRGIREYGRGRIVLSLCDARVTVTGEDLTMKTFFGDQIQICGRISGVEFG